jgi:hypothetical protein
VRSQDGITIAQDRNYLKYIDPSTSLFAAKISAAAAVASDNALLQIVAIIRSFG